MSSKALSPAANLLRNSRLMAMPNPIPAPKSTNIYAPASAPFPTNQAIAAPRAAAHRGEWGLKRDLPLRVSRNTLYVRYNDLDTIDHMTTFESAHDDVYTLKKWQEMGLALHRDTSITDNDAYTSNVSTPPIFDSEDKPEGYKWRYKGPNLKDLSAEQLEKFIDAVSKRQDEFYAYVARRQAIARLMDDYVAMEKPFTEEELAAEVDAMPEKPEVDQRKLRSEPVMLERYAVEFLDIPHHSDPPVTHPSAGLYYARSNAYCHNDPELGPQEVRQAVPGRDFGFSSTVGATAGVAGVVAAVEQKSYAVRMKPDRMTVNKYIPLKAKISTTGRIMLDVDRVNEQREEDMNMRRMRYSGSREAWSMWDQKVDGRRPDVSRGLQRQWYGKKKEDSPHVADDLVAMLRRGMRNERE